MHNVTTAVGFSRGIRKYDHGKLKSFGPMDGHQSNGTKRLDRCLALARAGIQGFNDYEIVELLLTLAIPRSDVKEPAKALIARFGSLRGKLDVLWDVEACPGREKSPLFETGEGFVHPT